MIDWNNKKLQTYINLATSYISMAIGLCISFFLSPYIIKHLGVEANGFASLASNFIMYATLVTIALNSMAARFISLAYHQDKIQRANKYYASTIIGNIVIVTVFILPAIYLTYNLENIISIEKDVIDVKIVFALSFLNFFVGQLFSIFAVATFITNRLYISNIISMFRTIINATLLIVLFAFFAPKIYFISAIALCLTIVNAWVILQIKKKLTGNLKFQITNFRLSHIKSLLSSGVWNAVGQAGHIFMTGLDLIIANIFINPVQMGLLAIAKSAPTQILSFGFTVNGNFAPNLIELYAKGDMDEFLKQLKASMKISSIVMAIPIITFCVFGDAFYSLWLPSLDANTLIVVSILTFVAFIPASGINALYNVMMVTNRLKFHSVTFLVNGIVNIIIIAVLLKYTELGIYAVAGVSSITTIIRLLVLIVPYTAKLLNLKWFIFYIDVLISMLCAIICFIIAVTMKLLLSPTSWITLGIAVTCTCIASFITLIFLLLSQKDRTSLLNKILRRKQQLSKTSN